MKKLLVPGVIVLAVIGFLGTLMDDPSPSQTSVPAPAIVNEVKQAPTTAPVQVKPVEEKKVEAPAVKSTASCGEDYYRNVDGDCVHRPTAAPSAPAGATARCRDGTYSYSQHRSGTCSHHGGVASWL